MASAHPADAMESALMQQAYLAGVWLILAEECGASHDPFEVEQFRHHWPSCGEYRFQGALGFGGKVWHSHKTTYVNCYAEDETPERNDMIYEANRRLKALRIALGMSV